MIKKCCNKVLIPKIKYKASIADSIGLSIFLGFFLTIAFIVAWIACSAFIADVADGTVIEDGIIRRKALPSGLLTLIFLYFFLPKFIYASSFLLNYTLNITAKCKVCRKKHELAKYPTNVDPF
jgi:hypothetical protein